MKADIYIKKKLCQNIPNTCLAMAKVLRDNRRAPVVNIRDRSLYTR